MVDFKYLNREAQHFFLDALLAGQLVDDNGHVASNIDPDRKYEIRKTYDKIPWSFIVDKFKWAARDQDGSVCVFEAEPVLKSSYWGVCKSEYNSIDHIVGYSKGTCDWSESLQKRLLTRI